MDQALRLLSRYSYTEVGLKKKLLQKGVELPEIEAVIPRLIAHGFLNDQEYAESYVRRYKTKWGRPVLRQKLLQKGIAKELINKILVFDQEEEKEAIRSLMKTRYKKVDKSDKKSLQKLYASLFRKGFSIESIRQVVGEIEEC